MFKCSACDYSSDKKENVKRHVAKKIPCSEKKTRSCENQEKEISCEYCNRSFTTKAGLRNHVNNSCRELDKIRIKELEKKLEEKETSRITINNTIINNNTIVVNNYFDTSLENITDDVYKKILSKTEVDKIVMSLIEYIHFNPSMPYNHNIRITNLRDQYMQIYNEGTWQKIPKSSEIDNMIFEKNTLMKDWVDVNKEMLKQSLLEKFELFKDQEEDTNTMTDIKKGVELLLYNKRHMTKD
jgi:C2H2-type zinc-finger domain/C2H2-type zinc finger